MDSEQPIEPQHNQIPQPEQHKPLYSFPKKERGVLFAILGVIIVLLVTGVVFAYWQKQKNITTEKHPVDTSNNPVKVVTNPFEFPTPEPFIAPTSTTGTYYTDETLAPWKNVFDCTSTTVSTKKVTGEIAWQEPKKVASTTIFSSGDPFYGQPIYYKIGHFASGGYAGSDLYLVDEACDGMCFSDNFYYLVKQGNKVAILQKDSSIAFETKGESIPGVGIDNSYSIADLNYPKTITGPQGQKLVISSGYNSIPYGFCADNKIKAFTDPDLGDVYTDPFDTALPQNASYQRNYGFYLQAPDGSSREYTISLDFVGTNNVPQVTWKNGQKNSTEYVYTDRTGCGSTNFVSVEPADLISMDDLIQTGTTSTGDPIYEFKDTNNTLLKDIYNNQYNPYGTEKVSYSQFVKQHPVFFWKDSFNRLIKFQNSTFIPMAECGKPVIYLYPQQTEKVSVQLAPIGGFTYTEPAYQNGWNVIAQPNGTLTNISDNKTYPYLFWEGRGGLYQTPNKGFVVAQKDVHQFLVNKLYQLGLNNKESADFIDFWEPKMQSAPYYFVTFMGNSVMDNLAPLTVSPKPDTVIRILMDFTSLTHPISAEGYAIRTPVRKGFTVVEWGGVLR